MARDGCELMDLALSGCKQLYMAWLEIAGNCQADDNDNDNDNY